MAKPRSERRPLRDLVNNRAVVLSDAGGGVKSLHSTIRPKPKPKPKPQLGPKGSAQDEDDDYLDRLLLVQSNLSSITRQIDELVAQAVNVKDTSKEGKREVESFTLVLSDMVSSLKSWSPRFERAFFTVSSVKPGDDKLGACLVEKNVGSMNDHEGFEVESPEETKMGSLISPSPLVSWREECQVERGRQLFLLTPLPMSKTFSSKYQNLPKSVLLERMASTSTPAIELPSLLTVSRNVSDDLIEGVTKNATPEKVFDAVDGVTEDKGSLDCDFVSSPTFPHRDRSILVMTSCLKMSPPKSCVLLEPISEFRQKDHNDKLRKSTPFPLGIHSKFCDSSSCSSEDSEDLTLKYTELLGIQPSYKSTLVKDLEASPKWSFSPPKTCVLLEPPVKSKGIVANDRHQQLPALATVPNQQANTTLSKEILDEGELDQLLKHEPVGGRNMTWIESTPSWKEPESMLKKGENTLKRELWTKFEAASTYGIRSNAFEFQETAKKKGFIEMLDEVSHVEEQKERSSS